MNILLTNDDGYNSRGINILKDKLAKYGTVIVVAPDSPMSAKSTSITIGRRLHMNKEGKNIFSCDGTPADCVSMAISLLDIKFDLVVSGCNNGLNISYDTIYSGTIGACLQALMYRIPAIAFSTPYDQFDLVESHFDEVFTYILDKNILSNKYLLNVNFPDGDHIKGIEFGELYYRNDDQIMKQDGDGYLAYRNMEEEFSKVPDSDCYQVTHNIVSIVPLGRTYFHPALLEEVKKKIA